MAGVKGKSGRKPLTPEDRAKRSGLDRPDVPQISRAPKAPKELDAAGREAWAEIYDLLLSVPGLASTFDRPTIISYCKLRSLRARIDARIADADLLYETDRGSKAHPLLTSRNAVSQSLVKYEQRFGLSPVDRVRLPKVPRGDKERDTIGEIFRLRENA